MNIFDILQILAFLILLASLAMPLGGYMARVFSGEKHFMQPILGWLEARIYLLFALPAGHKILRSGDASNNIELSESKAPEGEMTWKAYLYSLAMLNLIGIVCLFLIQVTQFWLPLNPGQLTNVSWHTALNTSISFVTNTNWQAYAGETTMSYFTQMVGLTVQNFLSAATGIAVLLVLIRGLSRRTTEYVGNFWVDLTRIILYVLLPLSVILAILLVSQGVIQNYKPPVEVQTLEGMDQTIPMGPVASQIAIKQLGTNGGGFFNSNSSHPFENPTPFSNLIEMLAILLIPAALTITFGKMIGSEKHGQMIFAAMLLLLISGLIISLYGEYSANPITGSHDHLEGKELRFGITNSVLWSTSTTAASNGSVNAMHDSLSPLSGTVAMANIMLGEVIFGGVGAGLYGMVVFIVLTVFIAGLMVGRTPEYLGKKIEAFEVKMAMIAVLAPSFVILLFSAVAIQIPAGLSSLGNAGPHGLSEILYAYSSAGGNNGSAFAGLNPNTVFYNITLGCGMIIGRFGVILPVMAIAGNLARKKITPYSAGTFRTDSWLFIGLLISVILIVGGLTFFPALAFGPIVEHLLLHNGVTF